MQRKHEDRIYLCFTIQSLGTPWINGAIPALRIRPALVNTCLESQALPIHAGMTKGIPASSSLPVLLLDAIRPVGGVASWAAFLSWEAEAWCSKLPQSSVVTLLWAAVAEGSDSQSLIEFDFSGWKGYYPTITPNSNKNCNQSLQSNHWGLNSVLQSCEQYGSVKVIAYIQGQ